MYNTNVSMYFLIKSLAITQHSPVLFSRLFLAMLILLFLYYLVHGASIDGSPIPSIDNPSLAGYHCTDLTYCRTIWSIIWSCLVTIFLCTWVAVHPNIPCPKELEANSWVERCILNPLMSFVEHRLPLFVCALLVPEYVLAWAIRQFLRALEIAEGEFELLVNTKGVRDRSLDHLHTSYIAYIYVDYFLICQFASALLAPVTAPPHFPKAAIYRYP